jgi:hypothetical protein
MGESGTYTFSIYPYEGEKRTFKTKAKTRAKAYGIAAIKNKFVLLIELDTFTN